MLYSVKCFDSDHDLVKLWDDLDEKQAKALIVEQLEEDERDRNEGLYYKIYRTDEVEFETRRASFVVEFV